MMMSWWIGLSREALWEAIQLHHFKPMRYLSSLESEKDSWLRGQVTNQRHRKMNYDLSHGYELPRAFDVGRSEWTDDPRVWQIEAERVYREWRARAYSSWEQKSGRMLEYDYAASLMVMLRVGRTPPEWTDDKRQEFERWCQAHQQQLEPMIDMVE